MFFFHLIVTFCFARDPDLEIALKKFCLKVGVTGYRTKTRDLLLNRGDIFKFFQRQEIAIYYLAGGVAHLLVYYCCSDCVVKWIYPDSAIQPTKHG